MTHRCNLSCKHCYAAEFHGGGELSREEALGVLEEVARSLGRAKVIFSGGEPLLREDLDELVGYASRLGLRVAIATNGLLMDVERASRLMKLGVEEVSVSIESASAEVHDELRGPGSFEAAVRAVKACVEVGLRVLVDPCISRLNVDEAYRLIELAAELRVHGLRVFHYVPMGRGREALRDAMLSPEAYGRWLHELWALQLKHPELKVYTVQAPQYTVLLARGAEEGSKVALELLEELSPGCRAAISTVSIKHNGDVTPCPLWAVSLGNLREVGLREALRSPIAERLRRREVGGRCSRCRHLELCGGCRVRAHAVFGDYFAEDPLCPEGIYEPR